MALTRGARVRFTLTEGVMGLTSAGLLRLQPDNNDDPARAATTASPQERLSFILFLLAGGSKSADRHGQNLGMMPEPGSPCQQNRLQPVVPPPAQRRGLAGLAPCAIVPPICPWKRWEWSRPAASSARSRPPTPW